MSQRCLALLAFFFWFFFFELVVTSSHDFFYLGAQETGSVLDQIGEPAPITDIRGNVRDFLTEQNEAARHIKDESRGFADEPMDAVVRTNNAVMDSLGPEGEMRDAAEMPIGIPGEEGGKLGDLVDPNSPLSQWWKDKMEELTRRLAERDSSGGITDEEKKDLDDIRKRIERMRTILAWVQRVMVLASNLTTPGPGGKKCASVIDKELKEINGQRQIAVGKIDKELMDPSTLRAVFVDKRTGAVEKRPFVKDKKTDGYVCLYSSEDRNGKEILVEAGIKVGTKGGETETVQTAAPVSSGAMVLSKDLDTAINTANGENLSADLREAGDTKSSQIGTPFVGSFQPPGVGGKMGTETVTGVTVSPSGEVIILTTDPLHHPGVTTVSVYSPDGRLKSSGPAPIPAQALGAVPVTKHGGSVSFSSGAFTSSPLNSGVLMTDEKMRILMMQWTLYWYELVKISMLRNKFSDLFGDERERPAVEVLLCEEKDPRCPAETGTTGR